MCRKEQNMQQRTNHHHRRRGPGGHGRHRARRGAVGASILTLLGEQPMHGYELITALEERSGGRWKPSPGSIYPALRRLEHRGLIAPASPSTISDHEADDRSGRKHRYELTDAGRLRVAEQESSGVDAPWDEHGLGGHGELRRAMSELTGPARQIGRFGSPDQVTAAVAAVKTATASLYRVLADGDQNAATDPDSAPSA
jgi:DNA-binding PadR family transcriptional regulator